MLCLWNEFRFIQLIDFVQVLDPIDGTRGFVRGSDALYVVCSLVTLNYLSLIYNGCFSLKCGKKDHGGVCCGLVPL